MAAKVANDLWRVRKLGEAAPATWGQAVADWLAKHAHERRPIEDIKDRLRWLTTHFERLPLVQIDRPKVERLMASRSGSDSTRNRYVAEVSKILSHAHALGWITAVPKLRRYKETQRFRWLTQFEAERQLRELPPHLRDRAEFSLQTGLCESNVRLLRWSHVDLSRAIAWFAAHETKPGLALRVPLNEQALYGL